ncbi:hypothetical protein K402DRAFT_393542 [Aulographum hederae CBS 113979]|uniref:Zn(2)-C6 fungal-type domain-containing protein n=1 Tax=Aulographum hederae CBS 113979 TaxID=1176131 RepID=A0A6G1GZV1_9PEZI|nr:hypothetical protein K402DRAFT_393542 [Aulographum hederae CBS 113979]
MTALLERTDPLMFPPAQTGSSVPHTLLRVGWYDDNTMGPSVDDTYMSPSLEKSLFDWLQEQPDSSPLEAGSFPAQPTPSDIPVRRSPTGARSPRPSVGRRLSFQSNCSITKEFSQDDRLCSSPRSRLLSWFNQPPSPNFNLTLFPCTGREVAISCEDPVPFTTPLEVIPASVTPVARSSQEVNTLQPINTRVPPFSPRIKSSTTTSLSPFRSKKSTPVRQFPPSTANSPFYPFTPNAASASAHTPSGQSCSTCSPGDQTSPGPEKKRKRPNRPEKAHKPKPSGSGEMIIVLDGHTQPQYQRSAFKEPERKGTAKTRKLGACGRCRGNRIRCNRTDSPYELCQTCAKSFKVSPSTLKMPCFLATIIDAVLFRPKPMPAHPLECSRESVFELLDINPSASQSIELRLTQDVGIGKDLIVYVTGYESQPGDKTAHKWRSGPGWQTKEMPHYCIHRLEEVTKNILQYIERSRGAYLNSTMRGSDSDPITVAIFTEAAKYAKLHPTSTVHQALSLFAVTRIIERDWRIAGPKTLGESVITDPQSPWVGKVPVTPMMDTQLDQIVIQKYLVPTRKKMLEELQRLVNEKKKEDFWEVFLTMAVLLTNGERLLLGSRRNAVRYGAKGRYNSLELAERYFHACKIMLSHFHYVSRGSMPLISGQIAGANNGLDAEQQAFLTQIRGKVFERRPQLDNLRHSNAYEDPLYWTHQLFTDRWNPSESTLKEV